MLSIKIEGHVELLGKLTTFDDQLSGLKDDWPQELQAWQREDMQRTYPNQTVHAATNRVEVVTSIWPRSRRRTPTRIAPQQVRPVRRRAGTRPILRDVLLERLQDRMQALARKAFEWPTTAK